LFSSGSFSKKIRSNPNCWATIFSGKSCVFILTKDGLGNILGDKKSGHTGKYIEETVFIYAQLRYFFSCTVHVQGCQIFLDTTYQSGKNIPNGHKVYQMAMKYMKWS
jgi:hypothetical protein